MCPTTTLPTGLSFGLNYLENELMLKKQNDQHLSMDCINSAIMKLSVLILSTRQWVRKERVITTYFSWFNTLLNSTS